MIKTPLLVLLLTTFFSPVNADTIHVEKFRYAPPYALFDPVMIDSVNVDGQRFQQKSLLDTPISVDFDGIKPRRVSVISSRNKNKCELHLLEFNMSSPVLAEARVHVSGVKQYRLFANGQKSDGKLTVEPGTVEIVIKCLLPPNQKDSLKVAVVSEQSDAIKVGQERRFLSLTDLMKGKRPFDVQLSRNGKYLITGYKTVMDGGREQYNYQVKDVLKNRVLFETDQHIRLIPSTDCYYFVRQGLSGREIVSTNIGTNERQILAENVPEGNLIAMPGGKRFIVVKNDKGPKSGQDVHEIVEPDDRQPGWRDRNQLHLLDISTGIARPLTYGFRPVSLADISEDGNNLLLLTWKSRLTARPTSLISILCLNLQTMKCDTIVEDDGFIAAAKFSPKGDKIVVMGSPECLKGIGKNVPGGRIPSMYDYQLYTIDLHNGKTRALTKDFNPSVNDFQWSKYDGKIYFTANDKDRIRLFQADLNKGKIERLNVDEDIVTKFSIADDAPIMAWFGESASNSFRIYSTDLQKKSTVLLEDLSKDLLRNIAIGTCQTWDFVNSRGDSINGRFYLPPNFDAKKQYPLIVNYYGGCSPTTRIFESRYPWHAYAAQGYVVYVLNPSGSSGFGQEFSSRHVNTAGKGVAEDIIEGTRKFMASHAFVDKTKVGCIGASYGGFMTQYLQTQTNMFTCAISHAGISDHTSYWGEGYWGYSYSEVSMAHSYPWSNRELYVSQSPLFNADKINTPILFLHGSADTNVPIGESIQMFTALKLLGKPCAFVVVDGENHHITDYNKRIKWQNTIYAWFAKYLKGDSSWWDKLYPPKNF